MLQEIRFDWKIMAGTIIAFLGAAFGSVGGVGGGGFFIPMLTLIIGFDQKSSIAVSKCKYTLYEITYFDHDVYWFMYHLRLKTDFVLFLTCETAFRLMLLVSGYSGMITGTSTATVLYNLRRRHPTLELPIIDYDLALLFQPLLVLGISIGVSLNVVLSDWMITILLFVVLLGNTIPYLKWTSSFYTIL